ncbi:hypothetical protein OF122_13725 [Pelagibacterium flavum]|uniref:Uncharacterized protein n=1 Tax=Pelagibacterium flavum TaxID=2984530 RepID=A0ABY6IP68_9HYPH|nr:hypothetical protein [Pelagibacterium sp. YIM 151497]UYQ71107.1 hypothetical protein OF122_13725 [Pelagibacterium sp. YIM 151497]
MCATGTTAAVDTAIAAAVHAAIAAVPTIAAVATITAVATVSAVADTNIYIEDVVAADVHIGSHGVIKQADVRIEKPVATGADIGIGKRAAITVVEHLDVQNVVISAAKPYFGRIVEKIDLESVVSVDIKETTKLGLSPLRHTERQENGD